MKNSIFEALVYGDKLPRKIKKRLLGRRIGPQNLKRILKGVVVIKHAKTCFDVPIINTGLFCPKCGCKGMRGTGNMTEYPEHWERFYCIRCCKVVGYIDNSPFIHALECKEDDYNPEF